MATFVLVHGAWHGGWCWKRVAPLLRAAGHAVYTPTLTGCGERVHLLAPTVGLETHIQDILGVLEYEDLDEVVLLGHSYGGMVISGVAERAAGRLRRLVYLDAFVPRDGETVMDLISPELAARFREQVAMRGDGWRVPPPPPARYGVVDPDDVAWVQPRMGDHPLLSFTQPVRFRDLAALALPRTFIWCAAFDGPFGQFAVRARTEPGWQYHDLPTSHDAMVTLPGELVEVLLRAEG
jgi:pimeloyl-ACP methyl ester carboxylesterase